MGVLLIVCGLIAAANIVLATVASVYYVGMLMLVGGIVYLVHAFQVRSWDQVLFWALSGVLYVLAGVFAFTNPLLASAALTLFLLDSASDCRRVPHVGRLAHASGEGLGLGARKRHHHRAGGRGHRRSDGPSIVSGSSGFSSPATFSSRAGRCLPSAFAIRR